jgi:C-terminal peptidase prc
MPRLTGLLCGVASVVTILLFTAHGAADSVKFDLPGHAEMAEHFADRSIQILDVIHDQHIKRPQLADLVRWAVEGIYREVGESVPPSILIRLDSAATLSVAGLKEVLASARYRLNDRPVLDANRDIAAAVAGAMRHLEPNSDPKSWLDIEPDGCMLPTYRRLSGIGLELEKEGPNGFIRIVSPIYGGPSYLAGIRAGERIVRIVERRPDLPSRTMDAHGQQPAVVARFLRGRHNTVFRLQLRFPDGSGEHVVEVRPGHCEPETVYGASRGADDRWRYTVANEPSIGYIRINRFGPGTHVAIRDVLTTHRGVRGWILDVRFSEGGLLSSSIQSSELLVGMRRVMTIYAGADKPAASVFDGEDEAIFKDRPVVCLVNGKTQSVAEVVAACLQDQGKALIVGERTAGRAEIHNFQSVLKGDMTLKLTTAVFVRPSGKHLSRYMSTGSREDDWGVIPDAGMDCRLSQKEMEQLDTDFRDAAAIYDPKFRPKARVVDRQLELALSAIRARIASD